MTATTYPSLSSRLLSLVLMGAAHVEAGEDVGEGLEVLLGDGLWSRVHGCREVVGLWAEVDRSWATVALLGGLLWELGAARHDGEHGDTWICAM